MLKNTYLLSIIILLICWIVKKRWKLWIVSRKLPGPPSMPIFGTTDLILKNNADILQNIIEMRKTYPSPMKLWIGIDLNIVIDSPEEVQQVLYLNKCIKRMNFYKFLECFFGSGLVTLDPPVWQIHRKLLNPCFNNERIQSFVPVIDEEGKKLMEALSRINGEFDLRPFVNNSVLNIVCLTTSGIPINISESENLEFLNDLENLFKIFTLRMFRPWLHFDFIYKKTGLYQQELIHSRFLNKTANQIFVSKVSNVSDQLMKGKLSKQDFIDEIKTLIVAGTETSTSAISMTILMLAMHPEIQEKVYEEILTTLSDDLSTSSLQSLKLLERVVQETLRLFPPVPIVSRKVSDDIQLTLYSTENLDIPSGATFSISIYNLHRNEDFWGKDANKFNPNNFLPENIEKRHRYCFVPFASGSRNCIGSKYAILSTKILIVHLLRAYKFSTELRFEDLDVKLDLSLKLVNQFLVSVQGRR